MDTKNCKTKQRPHKQWVQQTTVERAAAWRDSQHVRIFEAIAHTYAISTEITCDGSFYYFLQTAKLLARLRGYVCLTKIPLLAYEIIPTPHQQSYS